MNEISYGIGKPTTAITGANYYVDLETDTMYEWQSDKWVVIMKNGSPVDEHGNVIEDYPYY